VTAKRRGKSIDLPEWWISLARVAVDAYGGSLVDLGKEMAAAVRRNKPWHQSMVVRFLQKQNPTVEMADAISLLLGVPRLVYVARTSDEAHALQSAAAKFGVDVPAKSKGYKMPKGSVSYAKEKPKAKAKSSKR
jgi:hypothetical protein